MYLLEEFHKCIQSGKLRHYFIPCFNLLEIKLTDNAQAELLCLLDAVRQSDMEILGQCATLSDVWSKFCIARDSTCSRHLFPDISEILQNRIFEHDRNLIENLEREEIVLQTILIYNPYSQLQIVFDSLSSELDAYSGLLFLTKQRLCELVTIGRLFHFPQGNKSLYQYMKALHNNMFGYDIACSKLWLATFLFQRGDYNRSLQVINDVLSNIPPYAFNWQNDNDDTGEFYYRYIDMCCNWDVKSKSKKAWLSDMRIMHMHLPFYHKPFESKHTTVIHVEES